MKKITRVLALALGLVLLAACGQKTPDTSSASESANSEVSQEASKESEESQGDETVSFADWQDLHKVWNSITSFYEKDYLKKAADKKAGEESTTADALLKDHEKTAHTDITTFEFDGDKLILKDKEGKELVNAQYKYVKTIGKGVEHGEFAVFEAVGEVPEQFKAFAIMKPHGGEGDITHFHARYGKSVDDPELTNDKWWPVYVDPNSTEEQVINEILSNED